MDIWPGESYPLGATFDGLGTNFAVYSEVAERVELCLFDDDGTETRLDLPEHVAQTWHGYVPGVGTNQRYGFRAHGPYDPGAGVRCHPSKLLLDPYARRIDGDVRWDEACFAYRFDDPDGPPNDADSAPFVARSVVVNPFFDWAEDRSPRTPWHETIIYETHVRGFTMRHPDIPEQLRGTYAGLAHPAAIDHLTNLGVTAVELMPVHAFVHDAHLVERGLRNYWGYNSIGFFAPHAGYAATGEPVAEFKAMVRALHAAGLEVILDVVYNHTAEGNHLGPTLCFRGLDNPAYYRLVPDEPRFYFDTTGTGNSVNVRHPQVLQLIMDSLRYWVTEMHVDGFRFDLAATLARELHAVDRLSAFFDLIHQDPVLRRVKLIAEPWDVGEGGYQVGNFPPLWSEWNGRYRDAVRDYWRGEDEALPELAARLTGSSDLYQNDGRRPFASINFVTAHDGFTLHDLVAYNDKHNEANGEDNRDGESHNRSWNCGAEGPTDDPVVLDLRARQQRNLLATLLLSQGVPMLLGGDEFGRTQHGNNNAYCQDNELSWVDWAAVDGDLLDFTRRLVALRRSEPVLHRRRWFDGRVDPTTHLPDIAWFSPSGEEMTTQAWDASFAKCVAVFLNGKALDSRDAQGRLASGASFMLLLNAHHEPVGFRLPAARYGTAWEVEIDTARSIDDRGSSEPGGERGGEQAGSALAAGTLRTTAGRSVVLLRRVESE